MSKDKIFFLIIIVIVAMFIYNNYEQKKALNTTVAPNGQESLLQETYDAIKDTAKKGNFKPEESRQEKITKELNK